MHLRDYYYTFETSVIVVTFDSICRLIIVKSIIDGSGLNVKRLEMGRIILKIIAKKSRKTNWERRKQEKTIVYTDT